MAHYVLRLKVPEELKEMYKEEAKIFNRPQTHPNAGFDLFCPEEVKVYGLSTEKIDQGVKGAMEFFANEVGANVVGANEVGSNANVVGAGANVVGQGRSVGYFMYPRSSTGSKTPLRLANSIGVIDSGYRGNYIAVFDNWREESFKVTKLQRLVQICAPNITYPMKVLIVDDLGQVTERGEGGFGSTGS